MRRLFIYVVLTTGIAMPATAQETPEGIRAGAFIIQPSVSLGVGYDTNIFLEETNEDASFVATVSPRVNVISDWNRHEVALTAGGSYALIADSSDDNAFQFDVGLSGLLDVTRAVGITGNIGYEFVSEARGEDDTGLGITEPVTSHNVSAGLGADVVFGRVRVSPFGGVLMRDFQDVNLIGGGVDNQDDRDRVEYNAGLELGYSVRRGIEGFVRGQYGRINFQEAVDDAGVNRDSDGWRVLAGVKVDLTRLIEASAGFGYETRDFEDPTLSSVSGPSAELGVSWSITPLTTLNFDASRSFQETTITGSSVTNNTTLQFGVDHALLRNLDLGATLTYALEDFEGINREDNLFGVRLKADWRVMRLLTLTPSYQFRLGDSNSAGEDYTDHRFFLTATYGFQ
ncbi:MAG: outer membrane beta-barrel protein [Pseudomonadota bacterium]